MFHEEGKVNVMVPHTHTTENDESRFFESMSLDA